MGDGLANQLIVKWDNGVVDTQIEDVLNLARDQRKFRIGFNRRNVRCAYIVKAINGARLEFVPAGNGFRVPT